MVLRKPSVDCSNPADFITVSSAEIFISDFVEIEGKSIADIISADNFLFINFSHLRNFALPQMSILNFLRVSAFLALITFLFSSISFSAIPISAFIPERVSSLEKENPDATKNGYL